MKQGVRDIKVAYSRCRRYKKSLNLVVMARCPKGAYITYTHGEYLRRGWVSDVSNDRVQLWNIRGDRLFWIYACRIVDIEGASIE